MQILRRLLTTTSRLPNGLLLMAGVLLSRLLGLVRDLIVSYHYGTGASLAAYNAAVAVTDLLFMVVIGGALSSSFIPIFAERRVQGSEQGAWQLMNAVVSWALLVLGVSSLLLWIAAPWLTPLLYGGRGFSAATLQQTTELMRLFLWSPLLLGLGGLASDTLKVRNRFLIPALLPVLYNLGQIVGALLAPWFGINGLAWGVVVGAALYLVVPLQQLYALGFRIRPTFSAERQAVRRVALLMGPRVFGQAAVQISLIVTYALAVRLDDGDVKLAALRYATTLMMLPFGIITLSLSSAAFAEMATMIAARRLDAVGTKLRSTLGQILWLTFPATTLLLMLAEPITRLLYARGAFDDQSLRYTVTALLGYTLALPALGASEILLRGFYAFQRTWLPVAVALGQVALNISLGAILIARGVDIGGLALAYAVANTLEALVLLVLLQRLLPGLLHSAGLQRTVIGGVALSVIGGFAVSVLQRLSSGLPGVAASAGYQPAAHQLGLLIWLIAAGAGFGLFYFALSAVLHLEPAREIRAWLAARRRPSQPE